MALSVFIVEDSDLLRDSLTELLATAGDFRVVGTACSEMEAMEWFFQHPGEWDLATVDLLLSAGSGFHVLSRFKSFPKSGSVVILSDYVTDAVARRCIELGADAVFNKSQVRELFGYLSDFASKRAPPVDDVTTGIG